MDVNQGLKKGADKVPCPECQKLISKNYLKKHIDKQHDGGKEKRAAVQDAAQEILTKPSYAVPAGFNADEAQFALSLEDWDLMDISSVDHAPYQPKGEIKSSSAVAPKKRQQPEAAIQKKMEKKLGGGHATCPAGIVDILCENSLVEVKEWRNWKAAIGQTLAYAFFYPNRMLHIHFFGELPPEEQRIMIITICTHYRIKVTWEA
jgi:hypothetical protein